MSDIKAQAVHIGQWVGATMMALGCITALPGLIREDIPAFRAWVHGGGLKRAPSNVAGFLRNAPREIASFVADMWLIWGPMPGRGAVWFLMWFIMIGGAISIWRFAAYSSTCDSLLAAARAGRLSASDLTAAGCQAEARAFVIEKAGANTRTAP